MVEIRVGKLEDGNGVARLAEEVQGAPRWGKEVYAALLKGEGLRRRLVVAVEEALVVGFAVGSLEGEIGDLESVAVREGRRRKGLGRRLCAAVMEWCAEQGARWVELEVRAGNLGAQQMYAGLGFVEVGRRRAYYRDPVEDAVLLRAELIRRADEAEGGGR